jgi:hypothetical protein
MGQVYSPCGMIVRNKMKEAIDYYEHALAVRSGILSPEHPDIASS